MFLLGEKAVKEENLETLGSRETSSTSKYQRSAFLLVVSAWLFWVFFVVVSGFVLVWFFNTAIIFFHHF